MMEAEELKSLASLDQAHDSRLLLPELKAEFGERLAERFERAAGLTFGL
jgi:hypothetical protein